MPRAARQVGYALHALTAGSTVPWHRVVNARGEISARGPSESVPLQRSRLEAEGVVFGAAGRVDLERFGWAPRAVPAAPAAPKGRKKQRSEREPRKTRRPGRGSNA
jgi:hypothetical protein